jgi:hypothetical protein
VDQEISQLLHHLKEMLVEQVVKTPFRVQNWVVEEAVHRQLVIIFQLQVLAQQVMVVSD